ncbi:Uncharacterised protein [Vibrio cholerae]|uniref:Uncharacterized protein n=1 Tax=Vibrio cholerae TaxID=666 RepID=A0A655UQA4_VIBCL|nr:Uncharacterised protein [Vibrio cholerae]
MLKAVAHFDVDLAIVKTAFSVGDFHQLKRCIEWGTNLARIHLIVRVKRRFHTTQFGEQLLTKKIWTVFRTVTFTMFSPHQAAILSHQLDHLIGDFTHQQFLLGIAQIKRRTHMQYARIHMPKHAIRQIFGIEQRTKFNDKIG